MMVLWWWQEIEKEEVKEQSKARDFPSNFRSLTPDLARETPCFSTSISGDEAKVGRGWLVSALEWKGRTPCWMLASHCSGGNQRELARAKAAKKAGATGKKGPKVCRFTLDLGSILVNERVLILLLQDELSLEQRRQRDADAIKAKEAAKAAKDAQAKG
jgi:hypothetical protein